MKAKRRETPAPGFQRARKPEQIAVRREAILAAAAELFDAEGPEGAGLNAIAARAGFTKSNVYRYFETREAVLLTLFVDEFEAAVEELETALQDVRSGDVAAVARVFAGRFIKRPRLGRFLSIVGSVLEQNVSETVVIELKRAMKTLSERLALAFHRTLPDISVEDCAWVTTMIATLAAGMWPSAHPAPAVARVLAMPEFAGLKPIAERDLALATLVMFRGISKT